MGFFLIPSAGVGFFVASWILMLFWGIVAPDLGIPTVGYVKAMLITIGLWLTVAPLLGALARQQVSRSYWMWRSRT